MVRLWRFTCDLAGRCTVVRYAFGGTCFLRETLRRILLDLEDTEATVAVDYYRKGRWRPFDTYHIKGGASDEECSDDGILPF